MRICKKCGVEFPTQVRINGIRKNLGNRVFCLSCSPWGLRNTRDLSKDRWIRGESLPDDRKICIDCGEEKPIEDFYSRNDRGGQYYLHCKKCFGRYQNIRFAKKKIKAIEHLGKSCKICGKSGLHPILYDFHHRDPLEKEFDWGSLHGKKWEKVVTELEKCDLLCIYCHRLLHASDGVWEEIGIPLVEYPIITKGSIS